mmetsp:Transcript_14265/g.38685  ORF Transcript_14265/g.38685 Transcript_14265/m.38685 type:complete len:306 (+) Transcript_14265:893-1810(+)
MDGACFEVHGLWHMQHVRSVAHTEAPVREHIDQHHGCAWVVCEKGQLRYILYPPSHTTFSQHRHDLRCNDVDDLVEQLWAFLAVVIQAADQLLARMLRKVAGQRQVSDGCIGGFTQIKAGLVPELQADCLLRLLQGAHAVDEVEREELLEPHGRAVVLLEDLIAPLALLHAHICRPLLPELPCPRIHHTLVVQGRQLCTLLLAFDGGLHVHVQHHHLEQGAWELVLVGRVGPQRVQLVELVVQELEHVHLDSCARETIHQDPTVCGLAAVGQQSLKQDVPHEHVWDHLPLFNDRTGLRVRYQQRR